MNTYGLIKILNQNLKETKLKCLTDEQSPWQLFDITGPKTKLKVKDVNKIMLNYIAAQHIYPQEIVPGMMNFKVFYKMPDLIDKNVLTKIVEAYENTHRYLLKTSNDEFNYKYVDEIAKQTGKKLVADVQFKTIQCVRSDIMTTQDNSLSYPCPHKSLEELPASVIKITNRYDDCSRPIETYVDFVRHHIITGNKIILHFAGDQCPICGSPLNNDDREQIAPDFFYYTR